MLNCSEAGGDWRDWRECLIGIICESERTDLRRGEELYCQEKLKAGTLSVVGGCEERDVC